MAHQNSATATKSGGDINMGQNKVPRLKFIIIHVISNKLENISSHTTYAHLNITEIHLEKSTTFFKLKG